MAAYVPKEIDPQKNYKKTTGIFWHVFGGAKKPLAGKEGCIPSGGFDAGASVPVLAPLASGWGWSVAIRPTATACPGMGEG